MHCPTFKETPQRAGANRGLRQRQRTSVSILISGTILFQPSAVAVPLKEPAPTVQAQAKVAVRLLRANVRHSDTGFECHVGSHDVFITDPWSGLVDRVPFTKLRIRVEHPRVGRSDPNIYGLRTPLSVRVRGPNDGMDAQQWCIAYSRLALPERVSQKTWSKIDRLLGAFRTLGARVERWRPLEDPDPSVFDDNKIQEPTTDTPAALQGMLSYSE